MTQAVQNLSPKNSTYENKDGNANESDSSCHADKSDSGSEIKIQENLNVLCSTMNSGERHDPGHRKIHGRSSHALKRWNNSDKIHSDKEISTDEIIWYSILQSVFEKHPIHNVLPANLSTK